MADQKTILVTGATGRQGRAIDIAGDVMTMPEAAGVIDTAAKRPVEFVSVPVAEVRKFSAAAARMLEWFNRIGYDVDIEARVKESTIASTALTLWAGRVRWDQPGPECHPCSLRGGRGPGVARREASAPAA